MRTIGLLTASVALAVLTACEPAMTRAEALEAVGASVDSARGEALITEPIEVSTSFTLGAAVEDAAEELRAFWEAHADCATVTREGATVSIDHGTLDDGCLYEGRPFAGVHTMTLSRPDDADVMVGHTFTGMSNGRISLDGTADVTWSAASSSRTVTHALNWVGADGGMLEATGERTQELIDPELGLVGGIRVDGFREWSFDGKSWTLDIEGVEMRGQDPVPQAGAYSLTNPDGKAASLAFERLDDDTIEVELATERRSWVWEVTSEGDVDESSEAEV